MGSRQSRHPRVEPIPTIGISLEGITAFVRRNSSDMAAITDTSSAVSQIIVPLTKDKSSSYADVLKNAATPAAAESEFGPANVFVSHAWKYDFKKLCGTLQKWYDENKDTPRWKGKKIYFWLDAFVNNQHGVAERPFEWWETTFRTSIKAIGFVLIVFMPWNDPIYVQRAWCLFEFYTVVSTATTYEIIVSPNEEKSFTSYLSESFDENFFSMITSIDSANAQAYAPTDLANIKRIVEATVGYAKLNQIIFDSLRAWVQETCQNALQSETDSNRKLRLSFSIAVLLELQGKHKEAEMMYRYVCDNRRIATGSSGNNDDAVADEGVLECMNKIARSLCHQGRWAESEVVINEILAACHRSGGGGGSDNNRILITAKYNMALLLQRQGKFEQAETMYLSILPLVDGALGEKSVDAVDCRNGYAITLRKQGKYKEAVVSYTEYAARNRELLGKSHPSTLYSLQGLSISLYKLGRYEEAEENFKLVYRERSIQLGELHMDTLSSKNGLAMCMLRQKESSKQKQAACMLEECYNERRRVLGDTHPDTLDSLYNLAEGCGARKDIRRQKRLHAECLEKRTAALGRDHPDTLLSLQATNKMQ